MTFARDRVTWVAYVLLGWFAFLQAAPGLIVPHLRQEMAMSYSVAGLHVSALSVGTITASLIIGPLERAWGRRSLLWIAAGTMALGAAALTVGRHPVATISAVLVMGIGGGVLLASVQAILSDHHGDHRTVALAEANVGASFAYLLLIGVMTGLAALHVGWRFAIVGSIALPLTVYLLNLRTSIPAPIAVGHGLPARLPGIFWLVLAMMFCNVVVEWCLTGWGASYVQARASVSPDNAVTVMAAYFAGMLVGRATGSVLARKLHETRLITFAMMVTAVGFAVLMPTRSIAMIVAGLLLAGAGIGNLFPIGFGLAMRSATGMATKASARVVLLTSLAGLAAPLTVGAFADATSIAFALALVVPVMLLVAATLLAIVMRTLRPRAA